MIQLPTGSQHTSLDEAAAYRMTALGDHQMSSKIAHPAITELANLSEWKLVSYDRRGWGKSRSLGGPGTTLSNHVADTIKILSKLDHPIVIGHSYGALIALCAVGMRPDLMRAVVAFEPPVRWLPWWPIEAPWERLIRESAADGPEAVATHCTAQ